MPDIRYRTDNLHGPRGELASRVLAMPTDTNPKGDVFGGWMMSLMDMAGKMSATTAANGRVDTVAVERIVFRTPVNVGDVVCCYTNILRSGRSSITLKSPCVLRRSTSCMAIRSIASSLRRPSSKVHYFDG